MPTYLKERKYLMYTKGTRNSIERSKLDQLSWCLFKTLISYQVCVAHIGYVQLIVQVHTYSYLDRKWKQHYSLTRDRTLVAWEASKASPRRQLPTSALPPGLSTPALIPNQQVLIRALRKEERSSQSPCYKVEGDNNTKVKLLAYIFLSLFSEEELLGKFSCCAATPDKEDGDFEVQQEREHYLLKWLLIFFISLFVLRIFLSGFVLNNSKCDSDIVSTEQPRFM